jgi:hypothetical protein
MKHDPVTIEYFNATRIRYILATLMEYIEEVGPRDLRGFKDEIPDFLNILPEYNPFEDDDE